MTPETLTLEYAVTPAPVVVLLWVLFALSVVTAAAHLWTCRTMPTFHVWTRAAWLRRTALRVALCAWIGWTLWGAL